MTQYHLGTSSLARLHTCDHRIVRVIEKAIQRTPIDFSVLCGYRTREDQVAAYQAGNSKLQFPESKHNAFHCYSGGPWSQAVDVVPYPVDWDDLDRFHVLSGVILTTRGIDPNHPSRPG